MSCVTRECGDIFPAGKDTGIDGLGILLREYGAAFDDSMIASDGSARLQGLTGRISLRRRSRILDTGSVDEQFNPGLTIGPAESAMVGSPFIREGRAGGQGRVMAVVFSLENGGQHPRGRIHLDSAMEHADQIGRRDMSPAVAAVGEG